MDAPRAQCPAISRGTFLFIQKHNRPRLCTSDCVRTSGGLVSATAVATVATAVSTSVTAPETAFSARRTITLRASEGHGERAPVHLLAVPTVNRRLRLRFGSHLDEAEAA